MESREFSGRRAWSRMVGIKAVNRQRAELAAQRGWQFAEEAPWLLDRWPVVPLTLRGDMRLAHGALTGQCDGLTFTVFDYFRRDRVTNSTAMGMTVNQLDTYVIDTLWAVTLPAAVPFFQVASRDYSGVDDHPRPMTGDRKFDKRHRVIGSDPALAAAVLNPYVVSLLLDAGQGALALVGNELVYAQQGFTGAAPHQIPQVLGRLAALIRTLPFGGGPPAPQPHPQQPYPQQPYPQQPYPQQPYPQQPYPQQAYPPPGYPPNGGYRG